MDPATTTLTPALHIECPACTCLLSLRVWPDENGYIEHNDPMVRAGIRLHLSVGCVATT